MTLRGWVAGVSGSPSATYIVVWGKVFGEVALVSFKCESINGGQDFLAEHYCFQNDFDTKYFSASSGSLINETLCSRETHDFKYEHL